MFQTLSLLIMLYALIGLCTGAWLVWRGYARIVPASRGAPLHVRALWLPGAAVLWPLVCVLATRAGARA